MPYVGHGGLAFERLEMGPYGLPAHAVRPALDHHLDAGFRLREGGLQAGLEIHQRRPQVEATVTTMEESSWPNWSGAGSASRNRVGALATFDLENQPRHADRSAIQRALGGEQHP